MSIATQDDSLLPVAIGDYAAGPRSYFALLKPRVMSLVVWTALAGMLVAPVHVHPVIAFAALLAIAVGAGAAGALNMWWDADIDSADGAHALASRSCWPDRAARGVLFFGLTLSLIAVLTLAAAANLLAAGVAGLHDILLRRRLFDVAEARDAAEHRDWRRRGRACRRSSAMPRRRGR